MTNPVLDNLIVIVVLLAFFFIIYFKITGKTIGEFISDIKEGLSDKEEEVRTSTNF